MNKISLLFLFVFISCAHKVTHRNPSSVEVTEGWGDVDSKKGKMKIPYWYIKPVTVSPDEKLPVVYFLHGRGGSASMFRDLGGVNVYRNYLSNGGKPFMIVALTGTFDGKDTYWINSAKFFSGLKMKDIILDEMIPEIEKTYDVGGKNNRMISGISMGSHGAFQLALNSDKFKCVAGHSLVIRDYDSMSSQFPGMFGNYSHFKNRDPMTLMKRIQTREKVPFQKAWIDIGGKDNAYFIERARLFESELTRLGFTDHLDVAVSHPDGAHDSFYWKKRMPEYLKFYEECFE